MDMRVKKSLPHGKEADDNTFDLGFFINAVWRAKWKIIGLALSLTLIAGFFILKMPPVYEATATLLIDQNSEKPVSIDDVYTVNRWDTDYLGTQYQIIKSDKVAEDVIAQLNLKQRYLNDSQQQDESDDSLLASLVGLVKQDAPQETAGDKLRNDYVTSQQILKSLKNNIKISPVIGSKLVAITYASEDPAESAQIANAFGQAYINSQLDAKMEMTGNAIAWLQERSDTVGSELAAAEQALQDYIREQKIVDISGDVQGMSTASLNRLSNRLVEERAKRIELQNVIEQLAANKDIDLDSVALLNQSQVIRELRSAELKAETEYTTLDQRYGPKHPKMIAAAAELAQVREKISVQVGKELTDLQNQLARARETESKITAEISEVEGQFLNSSGKEAKLRQLRAEVTRLSELDNLINTRFKEVDITSDFDSTKVRFIDRAKIPLYPVKPNKKLLVIVAFVLATGLGTGIVLILAALNHNFRSGDQIESELNQRFLGVVPKVKISKGSNIPLLTYFDKEHSQFKEAIRTLRTSFLLSNIDRSNTVTLVTSSVPGEGKSTTCINLAFSLAQMGKVLIIDADLRRPTIAKRFDIAGYEAGLSNFLLGSHTINECIHRHEQANVDILPAGQVTSNTLELLSSPKFATLIEQLKTQYDRIVIDSAPINAVSDAIALTETVDSAVFVVKADATKVTLVKSALSRLMETGVKVEGAVLNAIDTRSKLAKHHGYYDYYGYSEETAG